MHLTCLGDTVHVADHSARVELSPLPDGRIIARTPGCEPTCGPLVSTFEDAWSYQPHVLSDGDELSQIGTPPGGRTIQLFKTIRLTPELELLVCVEIDCVEYITTLCLNGRKYPTRHKTDWIAFVEGVKMFNSFV